MTVFTALLVCLAVKATFAAKLDCRKSTICPCGSKKIYVRVCVPEDETPAKVCARLLKCEACEEGSLICSKCPKGLEGPFCSRKIKNFRERRQVVYRTRRQYGSLPGRNSTYCPLLDPPKRGSIACSTSRMKQSCTIKCLPGYRFLNQNTNETMVLTCREGIWTPLMPECKSTGYCELVVFGTGSFNCTSRMDGTRCDVRCKNRYQGQYFCLPQREWQPRLPSCVRPKPIQQKVTCQDPGFVDNSIRSSNDDRIFEGGSSVVYVCISEEYILEGSAELMCQNNGSWSVSLPKCIKTSAALEVVCPDPGQVTNAERLNTDGSPSVGVQQYKAGQSVVYTCHPGFDLQRRSVIACLSSGTWSFRTPYCTRVTTPSPAAAPTPTATSTPIHKLVNFNMTEISKLVLTELRFCPDPGVDADGSRRPITPPSRRGFPQGSRMEYACDQGFDLSGERSLFCLASGKWSASRPRCIEKSRKPNCGLSFLKASHSMRNGSMTFSGDWPWIVSIQVESSNGSPFLCGGAVLNSHTVLTAAHCLVAGNTLALSFGKRIFRNQDDDTELLVIKSRRFLIHPDYSNQTLEYDIGLVKLGQRIRFSARVQPVCLPDSDTSVRNIMIGSMGHISGWGETDELMLASLPVVSNEVCQDFFRPRNLTITDNTFCAGYDDTKLSVCGGSPFVFYDTNTERYTVEGLLSFGVKGQCGVAGKYATFTKVSKYREWILRNSK